MSLSRNPLLRWCEMVLLVALVAGVLVMLNYIAYRRFIRLDLTPQKSYSLAPQTTQVVRGLTDDLYATIFCRPQEREEIEEVVELFARTSSRFRYSFIDLEKNPAKAEAMGISSAGAGVVEYQGRREKVRYFSEQNLLSTIIGLTEQSAKTVRFVKGHGEKDINSFDDKSGYATVKQALEAENYQVADIMLMQAAAVPNDTLVLAICGPQKDFFAAELAMIDAYLQGGGNLLLLCDPVPLPNIERWLHGHGVHLARDFIVDTQSKLLALDSLTPIIMPDKRHPVGHSMNDALVFPVCRSVLPADNGTVEVLARSGPESWAERNTQSVYDNRARFDADGDMYGPIAVAVAATVGEDARPGHLIVMGDSDFASNHYGGILANKDFFLNAIAWQAEKQQLLSTRTRENQPPISILFLTENEGRLVFWSAVVIEPAIILLIGLGVALWRRLKR